MTGSHVVTGSNPVISTNRTKGRFPQGKRPFIVSSSCYAATTPLPPPSTRRGEQQLPPRLIEERGTEGAWCVT